MTTGRRQAPEPHEPDLTGGQKRTRTWEHKHAAAAHGESAQRVLSASKALLNAHAEFVAATRAYAQSTSWRFAARLFGMAKSTLAHVVGSDAPSFIEHVRRIARRLEQHAGDND